MLAILYVGHGTRLRKGVEEATKFLQQTMPLIDVDIQEIAFLELVEPNIVDGVARCVERGATSILVVPILLLTAQHAKEDIPLELAKAQEKFPQLKMNVAKPFGVHPLLIETVYERVTEQQVEIKEDAELLLIGRGSSDPAVEQAMQAISEQLQQQYSFAKVRACFLYGKGLSFEQALEQLQQANSQQVFIVPYLLFSGLLSVGIEKQVKASAFDERRIHLCHSLGYNDKVREVLRQRIEEAMKEGA